MLVRVAANARCDDQIDDRDHFLPVSLLVGDVLCLHGCDEAADQAADLLFESCGQLGHEFHTDAAPGLRIGLLQVILNVLGWLALVLF
mmetsp:Transcript_20575/g.27792  ORF Transcript_20575/g.27792 Transcript_20575/m.27792 type:complete len:88 (+) Transcript_20575:151-414(+)